MSDDPNDPNGMDSVLPESLLPYETWLEEAHRGMMLKALDYVSQHGLPGEHHFYITFLTQMAGVDIPTRLKERYPDEMTIVLQHQFRNLSVDHAAETVSVGLSFGGVPSTLHIPAKSIVTFADPHLQLMLRFNPEREKTAHGNGAASEAEIHALATPGLKPDTIKETPSDNTSEERKEAEVVSLAAFRKRPHAGDEPPQGGAS